MNGEKTAPQVCSPHCTGQGKRVVSHLSRDCLHSLEQISLCLMSLFSTCLLGSTSFRLRDPQTIITACPGRTVASRSLATLEIRTVRVGRDPHQRVLRNLAMIGVPLAVGVSTRIACSLTLVNKASEKNRIRSRSKPKLCDLLVTGLSDSLS